MKRSLILKLALAFYFTVLLLPLKNIFAEEIAVPTAEEIAKIEKRGKEIADDERLTVKPTDLLLSQAIVLALKTIGLDTQYSQYKPSVFR